MSHFGDRLRRYRRAKGLSLDDLASQTGISRTYLWKLEKKPDANPSLELLGRLAEPLGTSAAGLIPPENSEPGGGLPIPASLRQCQNEYGLTEDDVADLARIRFRGGHPTNKEDWFALYVQLKRALEPKP